MADKNHTTRWCITFGTLAIMALTLGGFIWNASAKNAKVEAVSEKQMMVDKIQADHAATLAQHNTAIAVIDTKLDSIITGQKEIKEEFVTLRKKIEK